MDVPSAEQFWDRHLVNAMDNFGQETALEIMPSIAAAIANWTAVASRHSPFSTNDCDERVGDSSLWEATDAFYYSGDSSLATCAKYLAIWGKPTSR